MHNSYIRRFFLASLLFGLLGGGAALAASCATCQQALVPKARFCYQCGTRVPVRKPVTQPTRQRPPTKPSRKPIPFRYAPNPVIATGSLKIGSAPIRCQVRVLGRTLEKKRAIQTITHVPVGKHTVEFIRNGKTVSREVVVVADQSTIVFGNLLGDRTTNKSADSRFRSPARHFGDKPTPQPTTRQVADADTLFAEAELLRRSVNPFKKSDYYRQAEAKYVDLLKKFPNSDKVELTLYQLGNIYESVYYRNYLAAIEKYKQLLDRNPTTALDVRWRIGVLYDNRQFEHTRAKKWFQMSAKRSQNLSTRKRAAARVKELEVRGF